MNIFLKTRFAVPSILLIISLTGDVVAQGWQERRLLEPSVTQQRMEQQGRVYIYDGLHEDTVNMALDNQFERVQNMMFVGMRHTTESGEEYADDDC